MGVGEQGISLLWCALIRKSMFSSGVNGFIFSHPRLSLSQEKKLVTIVLKIGFG